MAELYSDTWAEVASGNTANYPDGWPGRTTFPNIPGIGREMMAGIKREWNLSHPTLTTGGDGDLITLTPGTAITGYKHGQVFAAKLNANLGAAGVARPTLNVSGKGAKKIYLATYAGGHAQLSMSGGEAKAGQVVFFRYDSTLDSGSGGFVVFSYLPIGRRLESIEFALTTENGVPVVSASPIISFRLPFAFTFTGVKASLKTAQTSGTPVNVKLAGQIYFVDDIISNVIIDNGETTSVTAVTQPTIDYADTALPADMRIYLYVVAAGDGTARGLKVTLLGYQR